VADGVAGLHVKVGNGADLVRAIVQGADVDLHARLVSQLPRVTNHIDMAVAYLQIFNDQMAYASPASTPKRMT
jgi:hypothetical protein